MAESESTKSDSTTSDTSASGGESTGYSRGESQKPVSKAYKDNWNAIFSKTKKRR